jgi:hypothetical protein
MKEQELDALALAQGQHLEVFVLSGGKRQRPEGKLGAERELHVETARCHGLPGRILTASPFLARLCRRLVVRYLDYDREKCDDERSILLVERDCRGIG